MFRVYIKRCVRYIEEPAASLALTENCKYSHFILGVRIGLSRQNVMNAKSLKSAYNYLLLRPFTQTFTRLHTDAMHAVVIGEPARPPEVQSTNVARINSLSFPVCFFSYEGVDSLGLHTSHNYWWARFIRRNRTTTGIITAEHTHPSAHWYPLTVYTRLSLSAIDSNSM